VLDSPKSGGHWRLADQESGGHSHPVPVHRHQRPGKDGPVLAGRSRLARRTFDEEDQIVLEPPEGSPEDGIVPDLLFLRVPEGN